jgi:catalase
MPKLREAPPSKPARSPALSLNARPGEGGIRGRRIAILLAPGVDAASVTDTQEALTSEGAVVRLVAARLGAVAAADGESLEPDATLETMPSVLFDAVVVPDGEGAAEAFALLGQAAEFVKDQYRHCKPILMLGAGRNVVEGAGVLIGQEDWAMNEDIEAFIQALGRHRNWERSLDPPRV